MDFGERENAPLFLIHRVSQDLQSYGESKTHGLVLCLFHMPKPYPRLIVDVTSLMGPILNVSDDVEVHLLECRFQRRDMYCEVVEVCPTPEHFLNRNCSFVTQNFPVAPCLFLIFWVVVRA